jgi:hypothetical protein
MLGELLEAAIKINNRAYKRWLEKKGSYTYYIRPLKNRYGDPMDLSATTTRRENNIIRKPRG